MRMAVVVVFKRSNVCMVACCRGTRSQELQASSVQVHGPVASPLCEPDAHSTRAHHTAGLLAHRFARMGACSTRCSALHCVNNVSSELRCVYVCVHVPVHAGQSESEDAERKTGKIYINTPEEIKGTVSLHAILLSTIFLSTKCSWLMSMSCVRHPYGVSVGTRGVGHCCTCGAARHHHRRDRSGALPRPSATRFW
jgi:hypothetical protein